MPAYRSARAGVIRHAKCADKVGVRTVFSTDSFGMHVPQIGKDAIPTEFSLIVVMRTFSRNEAK